MTLKEKFCKATNKGSYFVIPIVEDAEVIEQIADDFAIDFAEWIRVCKLKIRPYDFDNVKELLEIFKEEKGL